MSSTDWITENPNSTLASLLVGFERSRSEHINCGCELVYEYI